MGWSKGWPFGRKAATQDDIMARIHAILADTGLNVESFDLSPALALVVLAGPAEKMGLAETTRLQVEQWLRQSTRAQKTQVILTAHAAGPAPGANARPKPAVIPDLAVGVKHIIAVASGKGGVGKSTVAANLAVALAEQGHRVGLLDADIYGPSVPLALGARGQKPAQQNGKLQPIMAHGLKTMSIGFLTDTDAPMIWRGPMVQSAIVQMLRDVDWSDTDILVVDMPPGTGDAQLTMAQKLKLSGAVIVSTPQDIALIDARKGLEMFQKMNVPILGVVENMSGFCCGHCGHVTPIFGVGGAQETAAALHVPFLGAIPLHPDIRAYTDAGTPVIHAAGLDDIASLYRAMAQKISASLPERKSAHNQ